jgi:hypothetical protein
LTLIEIWAVTPDMLMAALVYIAAGLLIRLWLGNTSRKLFIVFGLVLGLGYLAKSIMFPLALVFLGLSLFSTGSFRQTLPRVIASTAAFLFIALPYVILISRAAGEFTFGQSGAITYVRYVNGISYPHWQGEPAGFGTPLHPSRQIFEHPAVYEFGEPIGGTYPISLNPVYWYEGVVAKFDLGQQMRLLMSSFLYYFDLFFHQLGILLLGIFTFYMLRQKRGFSQREVIQRWGLAVAAFAAFGLYALVLVEGRYIGVFVNILFACLLANVCLSNTQTNKKLIGGISIMMVGFLLLNLIAFNLNGYRDLTSGSGTHTTAQTAVLPQWPGEVAETLHRLEVKPGDSVGVIGYGFDSYWARLAKVHIAAEMLDSDADAFWDGSAALRGEVMTAYAEAGVTAVVAEYVPENVTLDGWRQVGISNYYIYIIP